MNRFILCILLSFSISAALSQKVYFIYVQTEAEQPFYVKANDKLFNSTAGGYLILSNLRDTSYNIRIGFPQNKSEYSFTINVEHKDHGYLLKNFGEKGWGLFDIQTLSVIYSLNAEAKSGTAMREDGIRSSAFTEWLALAIDDPSIKEKPVYAVEELKKVEVVAKEAPRREEEAMKTTADIGKTDAEKIAEQAKVDKTVEPVRTETAKKVDALEKKPDPAVAKTEVPNPDIPVSKDDAKRLDESQKKADVFQEKTGVTIAKSEPLRTDTVVKETSKKPDVFQQKTGIVVAKTEPAKVIPSEEKYKPSKVSKNGESSTTEGFGLVFVDQSGQGADTIRLIIPNPRNAVAEVKQLQSPGAEVPPQISGTTQTKPQENAAANVKEQPKEGLKFLDFADTTGTVKKQEPATPSSTYITIETDKKKKEVEEKVSEPAESKSSNAYITIEQAPDKKKCPSVAGDNDFFTLRKRMASEKAEVDMLAQAKRYFKTKCFTTYQLKNLSALFLTDAAKFRFFDAAYAFVADEVNFKTLESEIKDDYYITRFQAMVGHKNF